MGPLLREMLILWTYVHNTSQRISVLVEAQVKSLALRVIHELYGLIWVKGLPLPWRGRT